ncbi:MAG: CopG antitoxin of type toxin-antitoxin system [Thermomicrobiales bacterium]|nr:CopG antitoxin of type toxin-antitoxin system [Thermomicrobiales bacterium]
MVHASSTRSRIPHFSSIEEEAEFWDTHDSTEFEAEFEPVELDVANPLLHGFSVAFEGPVFDRILAAAKRRGVSFVQLAEQWIVEGVERDEAASR